MKTGQYVTKEQLKAIQVQLSNVFDIVRVVDPYIVQVLDDEYKVTNDPEKTCFKIWNKNMRCSNCISLKAYVDFERKSKYEFQEEKACAVIAMPFSLTDDNNRLVILEMVNQVTADTEVKKVENNILTKSQDEYDNKLYLDSLTGLYNRRFFDESVYIYRIKKPLSHKYAFVLFDVAKFKNVNDTFGHLAGDFVLRKIASTMKEYTTEEEALIRLGGDEFLLIMQECDEEQVKSCISSIKNAIHSLLLKEIENYVLDINAGYAYSSDFDVTKKNILTLMANADINMYKEKKKKIKIMNSIN